MYNDKYSLFSLASTEGKTGRKESVSVSLAMEDYPFIYSKDHKFPKNSA